MDLVSARERLSGGVRPHGRQGGDADAVLSHGDRDVGGWVPATKVIDEVVQGDGDRFGFARRRASEIAQMRGLRWVLLLEDFSVMVQKALGCCERFKGLFAQSHGLHRLGHRATVIRTYYGVKVVADV